MWVVRRSESTYCLVASAAGSQTKENAVNGNTLLLRLSSDCDRQDRPIHFKKWSDLKVEAKKKKKELHPSQSVSATGGDKGTPELTPLETPLRYSGKQQHG